MSAPVITSVSPNPVFAGSASRFFTITGTGFAAGCQAGLNDGDVITNHSTSIYGTTQLVISGVFNTISNGWTAAVTNPDAGTSNAFVFAVAAAPSASPLADLDNIIFDGVRDFPAITALVAAGRIQVWDRALDARENFQGNPSLGRRVQIVPVHSLKDFAWSNGQARYERRFAIQVGTGASHLLPLRNIEWAIDGAVKNLWLRKRADGMALVEPPPFTIESILPSASDPHRGLTVSDVEEFEDVLDVTLVAFCPIASIGT